MSSAVHRASYQNFMSLSNLLVFVLVVLCAICVWLCWRCCTSGCSDAACDVVEDAPGIDICVLDFPRLTSDHSGGATCVQQEELDVLLGMVTQRDGSDEPPGGCPAMMAGHQIAVVECVKLEANEGCSS